MNDTAPATWQPYGRRHLLAGYAVGCSVEHEEDNPYKWRWAIWVEVDQKRHLLKAGTHQGTEAGAKQAVADALAVAAANLSNDAAAAAVVTKRAEALAPEVGA